jgi:2-polyprenyl-3-methyl-5-hydroxy-6-metoxy-1,4-benzoquinol methylase
VLRRCTSCGSAITVDPPAASADLYAQPGDRRLRNAVAAMLDLGAREQLRFLGPLERGSRVLDLGTGEGRLAEALARSGHQVTAVEPFRQVRNVPGVTVLRESVGELELAERLFDAAVPRDVLEHLPERLTAVKDVRRWLVPGGRTPVGVPNLASRQAWRGGERWFHLDPQRHVVALAAAVALPLLPPTVLLEPGAVVAGRGGAFAVLGGAP